MRTTERKSTANRFVTNGWYQRHRARLLEKRKQHDRELLAWLNEYRSKLRCIECGENHPACIQFHHLNRDDKSFTIGGAIGRWRYITAKKLKEEIGKCEVLCGNCHALRHWRESHDFDDWREVLPSVE